MSQAASYEAIYNVEDAIEAAVKSVLTDAGIPAFLSREVGDLPSERADIQFALGSVTGHRSLTNEGTAPNGGTFTLSDSEGGTTATIGALSDGATVAQAINGVLAVGAATVTGNAGGPWRILSNDLGDTTLTGNGAALQPAGAGVQITVERAGTASITPIWIVTLTDGKPYLAARDAWNATLTIHIYTRRMEGDAVPLPTDATRHGRMRAKVRRACEYFSDKFTAALLPHHVLVSIAESGTEPSVNVNDELDLSAIHFACVVAVRTGAWPASNVPAI